MQENFAKVSEDASNKPWLVSRIQMLQKELDADAELKRRSNAPSHFGALWWLEVYNTIQIGKERLEKI